MMTKLDDALQLDRIANDIANDMADQFSPGFCGNVMVEHFAEIVKKHITALRLEQETKDIALLDHFAAAAMQGLMNVYSKEYSRSVNEKEIADWSYDQAYEMLKERKKRNEIL